MSSRKPLFCERFNAINRQGAGRFQRTRASNDQPNEEFKMADIYAENTKNIRAAQDGNWQSVGSIAARLVERVRK